MRYSRGHQDISCQGCHESIHGLYPVTPNIDTTTYKQAAALNADGSHGPLKCATCHDVDGQGIPSFMNTGRIVYSVPGYGGDGIDDFDEAVAWAHIYTDEQSVLNTTCQNCHGPNRDNNVADPNSVPADWPDVRIGSSDYLRHVGSEGVSRQMMDKAEMEVNGGSVFMNAGSNPTMDNGNGGLCLACHGEAGHKVSCSDGDWLDHLTQGRVSAPVFELVSKFQTGGTCW
jgi:cytochrome c553